MNGHIKQWQIIAFIISYFLFGLFYWLFLSLTYFDRADAGGQVIIGSFIRAVLFIPVYWLIFKKFAKASIFVKVLLHLVLAPSYAWINFLAFRHMCDFFNVKSLAGNYGNWDIFMPFMVYIIQFSIIHAYDFFSRLKTRIHMEAELKGLVLHAELNALKAQIQPHFLFNTLNSINASIPIEQEKTRELISQLSDVFRFTLQASRQEYIRIDEEIQLIKSYLSLEQNRFSDKLKINYEIDLPKGDYIMPPMLLQPILENAIQHGVSPSLTKVTVNLTMKLRHDCIYIIVSDTGVGIGNIHKEDLLLKGTGLKNTNQRLLTQFGKGIKIEDNLPSGLKFSFSIPLKKS